MFSKNVHFPLIIAFVLGLWAQSSWGKLKMPHRRSTLQKVEKALQNARAQSLLMARQLEKQEGRLPKNYGPEGLETSDYKWWCSGFFPGQLWLLYEDHPKDTALLHYAQLYTQRVENVRHMTNTHDLGFMLMLSYGHCFRITGDTASLPILSEGALHLSQRFMPKAGVTLSWNRSKKWMSPVIIDNMMNLELLETVGKREQRQEYLDMARSHALQTIKNHYRKDFSCYHVVDYDDQTGQVLKRQTGQGWSDESTWARGQAWGLYGFVAMYRHTEDTTFLAQARHIARFLLEHPRMPEDWVTWWDLDCPEIPHTQRDASATAIMASALLELSVKDPSEQEAQKWLDGALKMLRSLSSPAYTAPQGTNGGFILMHSTGNRPGNSEIDVALSYADYYYVEALTRLKNLLQHQTIHTL